MNRASEKWKNASNKRSLNDMINLAFVARKRHFDQPITEKKRGIVSTNPLLARGETMMIRLNSLFFQSFMCYPSLQEFVIEARFMIFELTLLVRDNSKSPKKVLWESFEVNVCEAINININTVLKENFKQKTPYR
ncbi:1233_t:CDS:2, partial [Gigaspora rosea]